MLLFVTLVGCGVNANNYGTKVAKATCPLMEECFKTFFSEQYDNVGECVDDTTDYYDDYDTDDCEFDKSAAKSCLKWINAADCDAMYDDYEPDCGKVWDC